jgi:hypothetical protein
VRFAPIQAWGWERSLVENLRIGQHEHWSSEQETQHWVCALTMEGEGQDAETSGATTPELHRLAAWLPERKVETALRNRRSLFPRLASELSCGGGGCDPDFAFVRWKTFQLRSQELCPFGILGFVHLWGVNEDAKDR